MRLRAADQVNAFPPAPARRKVWSDAGQHELVVSSAHIRYPSFPVKIGGMRQG